VTRTVTLVLVDPGGTLLGALPPFPVAMPYWQETSDVISAEWERYALRLDVLRLLTSERPVPHGGAVTYLAEVADPVTAELDPIDSTVADLALREEPLRSTYARLGGPANTLAWARQVIDEPVTWWQQRTWNLSAIWRLDSAGGMTWVKQVPRFFGHEPTVLQWLQDSAPAHAPTLIAHDDEGRMLLEHVPGEDLYLADVATRIRIGELAHRVQLTGIEASNSLVAAGVPDRRGPALGTWIRQQLTGWVEGHPAEAVLDGLEGRLDAIAACGLPDTLVHGDAHPGNARSDGERTVFLDWGDAFVGNPVFDVRGMTGGSTPEEAAVYAESWAQSWSRSVPGSDPQRAVELSGPVAALRSAAVYAEFVASIEPTQRPFHTADVPAQLDLAVRLSSAADHAARARLRTLITHIVRPFPH
jgi:Phosphotransferase enzyme family